MQATTAYIELPIVAMMMFNLIVYSFNIKIYKNLNYRVYKVKYTASLCNCGEGTNLIEIS